MAFGGVYSIPTIISAFVTFAILMFIIRVYLKFVSNRHPKIQRPDWLKEPKGRNSKFQIKRK